MASQFVTSLDPAIPLIRLERYRTVPPCDLHMIANYFWNVALSESLYPTLHAVELALRNSIHATLSVRGRTSTWWNNRYTINTGSLRRLNKVRDDYFDEFGIPITPDRLVSRLNFGFWVIMLSGSQQQWIWKDKKNNWIDVAFPYRAGVPIEGIYTRFDSIRVLRNRIMHHECIFDRPDLRREHADIHQAIQWISPDLHAGIHAVDSFLEIHQHGWERAYNKLHGMLGGP